MTPELFITQRTGRHVIKRMNSTVNPAVYDGHYFGEYKQPGSIDSRLNFPIGTAKDISGNIYICDCINERIVKLDSDLVFVSKYDTSATIGKPYAILFDSSYLYIVGIYNQMSVRIEKITTALTSSKVSGNLETTSCPVRFVPTGIVRGFTSGTFAVSGINTYLYVTTESTNFSPFSLQTIYGETTLIHDVYLRTRYVGMIQHSNGFMYLNNGKYILKVDTSYVNVGDSDKVSETSALLTEGVTSTILTYDDDLRKIVRYDQNLNRVDDVFTGLLLVPLSSQVGTFILGEEVVTAGPAYGRGTIIADNGSGQLRLSIIRDGFNDGLTLTTTRPTPPQATGIITAPDELMAYDATDVSSIIEVG